MKHLNNEGCETMVNTGEALALCGGGGKGAYQIGVLKAMCENNILDRFDSISGTSVGALNSVLFAIGDSELAESIWIDYVSPYTMLRQFDTEKFEISRDVLKLILKRVGVSKIRNNDKRIYIYTHNYEHYDPTPFLLNDKSEDKIIDLLLASSAMPIVYSPVSISGEQYIDGGVTALGNTPVKVLADIGYDKISIVALDHSFNPCSLRNLGIDLYSLFPKVQFDIIKPSRYIGKTLDGTLDFSTNSIKKRISIGYYDAIKKYCEGSNSSMSMYDKEDIINYASKILKTADDFKTFVTVEKFKMLNVKIKVIGGDVWYDDIYTADNWKIQQHSGLLPFHYRIIDPELIRRAWTLDPDELVLLLLDFDQKFKKAE